jgi:RHS repeat-associated protein
MPGAARIRRVLVVIVALVVPAVVLAAPAGAAPASPRPGGSMQARSPSRAAGIVAAGSRLSSAAAGSGTLARRRAQVRTELSVGRERSAARVALGRAVTRQERLSAGQRRDQAVRVRRAALRRSAVPGGSPVLAGSRLGTAGEAAVAVRGSGVRPAACSPDPGEEGLPLGPVTTGVTGALPESGGGAVFAGEQVTASVNVYNGDCTSHPMNMTFQYQCGGDISSSVGIGTVTAPPSQQDPPGPGAPVSFTFSVSPSVCAAGALGSGPEAFTWGITATPADIANGTAGTSLTPIYSEYLVPPAELIGCPGAGNNAGVLADRVICADPVDTDTGDFADAFTDAAVHGPGYPLTVARDYSSGLTSSGALRPGWTMPWFASLSVDAGTGNVTFNSENGSQYLYTNNFVGPYRAPVGARSVLVKTSSGGYTLTTPGQDVLAFTSAGQLTSEVDPTGRGLSFAYTGGQLTSVTDSAGHQVTLAYTSGLLTKITLPDAHTIGYGYTGGMLTSVTTPGGASGEKTTYAYTSGRLTSIQDPDGNLTARNTYNASGEVTSQEDAAGNLTSFSYTTTSGGLPETDVTSPDGGITTAVFGGGALLETVAPLTGATSYIPGPFLEPAQATDPLGRITAMTYDGNGNLESRTDPLGNIQQWTYDSHNNLTRYQDPAGHVTGYVYNPADEPISVTTPGGTSGEKTTYAYNAAGALTSSVSPRGNASGASPASFTTTYTYNAAGQVASVQNSDGDITATTYDSMGSPQALTDPLGRITTYGYNSAEELATVTAPDSGITKYGYDLAGNLTTRTDPDNHAWTYGYDADNRLDKVTDPLTGSVTYGYNGDGDQATFTGARGITATTAYDTDDRPVKITYSDGTPAVSYGYDADSDTTAITDATGARTLAYDADGNLTRATGPGTTAFTYGYNPDGDITSRAYPDGTHLTYAYNSAGQASLMTDVSAASAKTAYAYDADGNLTSTVMPDGVTEARGYDNAGQLASITDTRAGTTLDAYALTLNADGQPTRAATTQESAVQAPWLYTYNPAGQLTAACQTTGAPATCTTAAGGNETTWTYDKAGNKLTQVTGGTTTGYAYNADEELTTATAGTTAISYAYDADGDLTTAGTSTYAYNGAGELGKAVTSAGTFTYTYDATGDLSGDSKNGTLQQTTIWDLANPLPQAAEQTSAAGATTADLLYNPNATLNAMTTTAGTDYATTNWLGSVTGLISSAGTQVSSTTFTPYGTPTTTGTPVSPVGFAGSYTLPGSGGLDDMNARDYNPANGAFTSVDPLLAATGQPYAYAGDSPVAGTDPSGECSGWFLCGIVNDVVGGAVVFGGLLNSWYDNSCGGPDAGTFVVTPRGVAYQIPKGWTSKVTENGRGIMFQRPGAKGDADSIRVMEPTARYPNGYSRVYNSKGQAVDSAGSPGNRLGREATHFPEDEIGDFPVLPVP